MAKNSTAASLFVIGLVAAAFHVVRGPEAAKAVVCKEDARNPAQEPN
ncbi:hypothetical protein NKY66_10850 [Sinorhizobium meliloti]